MENQEVKPEAKEDKSGFIWTAFFSGVVLGALVFLAGVGIGMGAGKKKYVEVPEGYCVPWAKLSVIRDEYTRSDDVHILVDGEWYRVFHMERPRKD